MLALHSGHHGDAGRTVAALLAMPVAMMLPSTLPLLRYLVTSTIRRARATGLFVGGYLLIWTGFGALALPLGVHNGRWAAATLILAAGWQLTGAKRARLRGCRQVDALPVHGVRADLAALRLGLRHGADCVGACWAVMLAVASVAIGQLGWMVLGAGLVWAEKVQARHAELARPTALGFAVAALGYALLR